MKIAESMEYDDGKLTVKKTHDFNPVLDRARLLRDAGKERMGESRLVATVPRALVVEWAKKAGVRMDDADAMQEVMRRNLLDPENSQFRVWGGTY